MIDEDDLRSRLHAAVDAAVTDVPGVSAAPPPYEARIAARARTVAARRTAVTVLAVVAVVAAAAVPSIVRDGSRRGSTVATATPGSSSAPAWSPTAEAPIEPRFQHTAVLVGDDVLVFGGYRAGGGSARGAALFHASRGTWVRLPDPPVDLSGGVGVSTGDGALALSVEGQLVAYDGGRREWSRLGPSPFAAASSAVTSMVWTGDRVVVVNSASGARGSATYDPAADRWRSLDAPPYEISFFDGVWTGASYLAVADVGGSGKSFPRLVVLELDVEDGTWRELPAPPLVDVARRTHGFAVWTGTELVTGGGRALTEEGARLGRVLAEEHREATTDERALLQAQPMRDLAAFDPVTGTWRSLPDAPEPVVGLDRYSDVWTGTDVLVWNQRTGDGSSGRGGRPLLLDPATGRWAVLPEAPAGAQQDAPVVWTGGQVFVWSGEPAAGDDEPSGCCEPSASGFLLTPSR
jgi:hypothetical protein